MSHPQDIPLADGEIDPEAAMREMMGFSSFTTRPKKQTDTAFDGNHSQAPAPEISSQAKSKANPNSHSTLDQNGQQWGPTAPMFDPAANPSSRQDPTPAFTSPETGISFTHEELKDLMEGKKINERGDKVYFKPGFVTNDPWARLRGNQQNKE